jgi:hypothetical protein
MTPRQPSAETARLARAVPILLVVAACLFNAFGHLTELRDAAPDVNDDVLHLGLIVQMNAAWDAGHYPLDTWVANWGQGFPVLRYYQHLPHFVVVLAYRALGSRVPLPTVFDGATWLLLALMPLTFYVGSRRLGAAPMTAACIALCTPLLGADPSQHHYLGFQARSFLWSGGGLFTQLAAIVLFPLAVGAVSQAALRGRRYAPAIAWLGATWLCHLVLGYIACLLSVVVLLRPEARGQGWRVAARLVAMFAGVAVVAAYLLLPTLLEGQWLSHSMWEPPEYWHSYGARRVLTSLATGGLLDGHRLPVLTILAGLGAVLAARAWLERRGGAEQGFVVAALGMFLLGLLLFFGRPTWGVLLGVLPFSGSLPMHRFICAVQFGGLLLAGIALARFAQWLAWSRHASRAALAVAAVLIVLGPAIARTAGIAQQNATWRREAAAADVAAGPFLGQAFAEFAALDAKLPGRGYAGTSWDWGSKFKVGGTHVYNRWSGHGLPAISYMYHTMGLCSDLESGFDPARRDHFELFNVRYLLADDVQRLPRFAAPRSRAPGLVSSVVDTEGYFGVVGSAAFVRYRKGEAGALREFNRAFIASRWHAERRFVRIGWREGDAPSVGEQPLTTGWSFRDAAPPGWRAPRGEVLSSSGRGDRYQARVRLDDPGLVLFRMSYHPNWHATLDDQPVSTVMLSPGYLGIAAPPGEHAVEMTYRSPAWTRTLPWVGVAFLMLVTVADARRLSRDRHR